MYIRYDSSKCPDGSPSGAHMLATFYNSDSVGLQSTDFQAEIQSTNVQDFALKKVQSTSYLGLNLQSTD